MKPIEKDQVLLIENNKLPVEVFEAAEISAFK